MSQRRVRRADHTDVGESMVPDPCGGHRRGSQVRGRAVQVDPMKPTLKAPGSKRLKLEHEKLLSNVGFNFNLRRYTKETFDPKGCSSDDYYDVLASAQRREAGAYTRPLLSST